MLTVADLKIKIFADGADHDSLINLYEQPYIRGFTTNPTLMRKASIANYEEFARRSWPESKTDRFPSKYSPTSSTRWKRRL